MTTGRFLRQLYNDAFLDSGCTLTYDESYEVDDLFWTYVTNYIIAGVCFVAAVVLYRTSCLDVPIFFLLVAIGNVLAGYHHQTNDQKDVGGDTEAVAIAAACLLVVGHCFLIRAVLLDWKNTRLVNILWMVLVSGLLIFVALDVSLVVVGIIAIASYVITGVYCLRKTLKVVGLLLNIGGMVVQFVLAPTCGDDGYKECFESCPLPDATTFNHNALFHVFWATGLALFAIGEYLDPIGAIRRSDDTSKGSKEQALQSSPPPSDMDPDI